MLGRVRSQAARPGSTGDVIHIRDAAEADLTAIRRLYNALIPTTTVAWRDEPASEGEMRTWFAGQREADHPVLVGEIGGEVVGYTAWTAFRGGSRFPGYRATVELTIHVDGGHHGRGVGRQLLTALIDVARQRGIHVMVAGIDADNAASISLHEAMGFREVARMPEVGRKFDRWLDLILMQRILS
jgi:phosphinothricin acetyltransferase